MRAGAGWNQLAYVKASNAEKHGAAAVIFVNDAVTAKDGDKLMDFGYLATAMAGTGFQVATRMIDRDPPDVPGAARFCTQLFMGGIPALPEA